MAVLDRNCKVMAPVAKKLMDQLGFDRSIEDFGSDSVEDTIVTGAQNSIFNPHCPFWTGKLVLMDRIAEALLESWDRNCQIVSNVATLIDDSLFDKLPNQNEWSLGRHLAHICSTRSGWLETVSPEKAVSWREFFDEVDGQYFPKRDLNHLRAQLVSTGKAIGEAVREHFEKGSEKVGGYDHPVFFLQHMLWHDGWHVGIIMLGLRQAGIEPPEEWEEPNIWGLWRVEEPS